MRLPSSFRDEIVRHAREEQPKEVCGLIAGRDGYPVHLYRAINNDPRPNVRYNVDPLDLLRVLRDIEDRGWELLAIYHSHPHSEAYPSATDVGLAYYPEAVYIITSLAEEDAPVVSAFRIVDGRVVEEGLEIDEASPADLANTPSLEF